MSVRKLLVFGILLALAASVEVVPADDVPAADLVVKNAKIVTVDKDFTIAQALAVVDDRIVAIGTDAAIAARIGPKTKVVDAHGKTIVPGLYDSHTHPVGAATSELDDEIPYLAGLEDVYAYIRRKQATTPEGHWIVLRFAFPTRLKEARFPTIAELDAAAPKHPVPITPARACLVNSMGLKVSGNHPRHAELRHGTINIVRDRATGEPTGMLRNAEGLLIGGGREQGVDGVIKARGGEEAVPPLQRARHHQRRRSGGQSRQPRSLLRPAQGRRAHGAGQCRSPVRSERHPRGDRQAARRSARQGRSVSAGLTGVGGVWIRIGPIKFFLDGGMLNGTAYMRQPWPPGETYQVTEDDYRGLLLRRPATRSRPCATRRRKPRLVGHRPYRRRGRHGRVARRPTTSPIASRRSEICDSASRASPTSRQQGISNAAKSSASSRMSSRRRGSTRTATRCSTSSGLDRRAGSSRTGRG